jgi:hypothetical protein
MPGRCALWVVVLFFAGSAPGIAAGSSQPTPAPPAGIVKPLSAPADAVAVDLTADPLRSAVPSGFEPGMGDLVASERVFGPWSLRCDALLSAGGRTCSLVTSIAPGVQARVALTRSLRSVFLLEGDPSLGDGQVVLLPGDVAIRLPPAVCLSAGCAVAIPFDGRLEAALSSGRDVAVRFGPPTAPVIGVVHGAGFVEASGSLSGPPDGAPYGAVVCGVRTTPWSP